MSISYEKKNLNVLIPTCKPINELDNLREELISSGIKSYDIIVYSSSGSAAQNRNGCLDRVDNGELIIMMDDDMTGFYTGWAKELIRPFYEVANTIMTSARLLRPDGKRGVMVGESYDMRDTYEIVKSRRLPTACIAFIKDSNISFDENFIGSGFEDDSFCRDLADNNPNGLFIINNDVKLIHLNDMKNQKGIYWKQNKKYYLSKYPDEKSRWDGD